MLPDIGPVAILADIIGSRRHEEGSNLFYLVHAELERLNTELPLHQPLSFTIGDELQGIATSLPDAFRVSLALQLIEPNVSLRVGIGAGDIEQTTTANRPFGQTGHGWWNARHALERARTLESPRELRTARTIVVTGMRELDTMLNSVLVLRDHLVQRMDRVSKQILVMTLQGAAQYEIAHALEISASSVSRRVNASGIKHVIWTQELAEGRIDL